eukprot:sb/3475187/
MKPVIWFDKGAVVMISVTLRDFDHARVTILNPRFLKPFMIFLAHVLKRSSGWMPFGHPPGQGKNMRLSKYSYYIQVTKIKFQILVQSSIGAGGGDFGLDDLLELKGATNFPWLMTNVIDNRQNTTQLHD